MKFDLGILPTRRVPFVAASEQNECGLSCLAAICDYHHGLLSLPEIRQLARHSGRGETMLELRNLAEKIGLSARGIKVEPAGLPHVALPAILHWDMNHFVVLERLTRAGAVIMDPVSGRMHISRQDLERSFTGVVLEIKLTEGWKRRTGRARKVSALDFVGPLSRWRNDLTIIVTLSVLLEILVLALPLQMQVSVDTAIQASDGRLVWILGIGFGTLVLIQIAISLVRAWAVAVFGARVGFNLRDQFVRALHAKPADFFMKHHTADLLSRSRSVDAMQSLVSAQLIQALLDFAMSIAMVAIMFVAVPLLAAVVLGFGIVNVGISTALRQAAIENSRRYLRSMAKADETFLENARAAKAIKLFGREAVRTNMWRNRFVEVTNLALQNARLTMYGTQTSLGTGAMSNVVLIATATWLVLGGGITLGTMMMFVIFQSIFVHRLNSCVNYVMELRRVRTHAERIQEVVESTSTDLEVERPPFTAPPTDVLPGLTIELRDVWFRYGNDSPWILRGANLRVAAGESVALTGPSGCGKSTVMGLMLGLLQPTQGEVLVHGRSLATISSDDYARVSGVVMQDDVLFHGTVADNIAFFAQPVDRSRVKRAATKANIDADINTWPMGYYSLLAEAAQDISGGQKQRIFIARAIYHEPQLLFLDEATSHLDTGNEHLVSEAIKAMSMTRVLIAHRKETIATADRAVVVRDGGLHAV